jgi:hypothetical protein
MAQHWKQTDDTAIPIAATQKVAGATQVTAPPAAVYVRFAIAGDDPLEGTFSRMVLLPAVQPDSIASR